MRKIIASLALASSAVAGFGSTARAVPTLSLEIFEGAVGNPALIAGPGIPGYSPTATGEIEYTVASNADFNMIMITAGSAPFLDQATLAIGAIDISSTKLTAPREIRLIVTATGLGAQNYDGDLISQFTALFPQKGVTKLIETSYYDNTNTAFGMQHLIDTVTFTHTDSAILRHHVSLYTSAVFSETLQVAAIFSGNGNSVSLYPSAEIDFIPEPASSGLVGAGFSGLGLIRRRRVR